MPKPDMEPMGLKWQNVGLGCSLGIDDFVGWRQRE